MPVTARVTIEGMDEVRSAFRNLGGPPLVKELGQVHKRIGQLVIDRAGGAVTGVGEGQGSTIRPSADTRGVVLLVGGSFRVEIGKRRQWGIRQVWPAPRRPYLIGAALAAESDIEEAYLDGVAAAAKPLTLERR